MRLLLFVLVLSVLYGACNNMTPQSISDNKFCNSLEVNDKNQVKSEINQFLATLSSTDESKINFEKIKVWLEAKSCIKEVETSDRIIATDPPLIEFKIVMEKAESGKLGLKISFDEKYQFYDLKRVN